MSAIGAIARRELGAALDSAVFWVAAVFFVVALHAAFFFLGYPVGDLRLPGFWEGRLASLDTLFTWIPIFFGVLAPALTMGAWAQERREGTEELLLSQPITIRDVVLGKFLAAWGLLCALTALAVVPAALMVAAVGPLDWGTALSGLCAAFLLAAACVAVGLLASSLTQDVLVAFLAATAVLLGLWSCGLFVRVLPASLAEIAWYASPSLHFLEGGARGVFDLRDLVYYALFAGAALVLNTAIVEGRRWR